MAREINGISVSYDYVDLLHEFQFDQEHYIDGKVFVEREPRESYSPIIDWYYSMEQVPYGTKVELMTVKAVIAEMKELTGLL
ncbi:hypothetical protein NHG29_03205 [Aerococcaceae bacterium NML160702]|nr:hypothetical protein [Aerococcaceae bacterium NML160702]